MNKKQRILMVCTLPPPVHGSAMVSQYIKESKLINNVFDMDFVNLSTSRKMSEIGKGGIVLTAAKLLRIIRSLLKTFVLLLFHRYDLCYCAITISTNCFWRDACYVMMCKIFGNKVVIHQHNKGMSVYQDRSIYKWLYPMVYKNSKVILLSDYLFPDISRHVDRQDVMICPNGIAPTESTIARKSIIEERCIHMLFLSNLIESKGCIILLDACVILRNKGYRFKCDFVGGDTYEISTDCFNDEIRRRGLDDFVTYHGRKYGKEKDMYWAQADVFVFPTYYYNECFPLVLLEAMEKGVACISTEEGGIRDIINDGKTGYVVPRKDAKAVAEAIEKLIVNPDLCKQMGQNGRKKFEEAYTVEIFEQKMLECLKNCID